MRLDALRAETIDRPFNIWEHSFTEGAGDPSHDADCPACVRRWAAEVQLLAVEAVITAAERGQYLRDIGDCPVDDRESEDSMDASDALAAALAALRACSSSHKEQP